MNRRMVAIAIAAIALNSAISLSAVPVGPVVSAASLSTPNAPVVAQTDWQFAASGNAGAVFTKSSSVGSPGDTPHLGCQFWVYGMNFDNPTGTLQFSAWSATGQQQSVGVSNGMSSAYSATQQLTTNRDFLNGPYVLDPAGQTNQPQQGLHYKVDAISSEGKLVDSKVFWVDCPATIPPTATATVGAPNPALSPAPPTSTTTATATARIILPTVTPTTTITSTRIVTQTVTSSPTAPSTASATVLPATATTSPAPTTVPPVVAIVSTTPAASSPTIVPTPPSTASATVLPATATPSPAPTTSIAPPAELSTPMTKLSPATPTTAADETIGEISAGVLVGIAATPTPTTVGAALPNHLPKTGEPNSSARLLLAAGLLASSGFLLRWRSAR